jgi:hemerythrin-like domain-containing protein
MSQSVLSCLKSDHHLFTVLLDAAAEQIDALEANGAADAALLKAIAGYFTNYPQTFHHPLEEVIYGHLACCMPGFADDVYGLVEDHKDVAERARAFRGATELLDAHDPSARRQYIRLARAFVEGERAHLTAEEQLFFPYAERLLSRQQWAEVERASDQRKTEDPIRSAITQFPEFRRILPL